MKTTLDGTIKRMFIGGCWYQIDRENKKELVIRRTKRVGGEIVPFGSPQKISREQLDRITLLQAEEDATEAITKESADADYAGWPPSDPEWENADADDDDADIANRIRLMQRIHGARRSDFYDNSAVRA